MTLQFDQNSLDAFIGESKKRYPEEACGLFFGEVSGDVKTTSWFAPCRNLQNEWHQKDPERYSRTARTAYVIDPEEMRRFESEAAARGMTLLAIAHSHPDHEAYFSEEDRQNAAPWEEPLFPGVSYVVASLCRGDVKAINEFFWNDSEKKFLEKKIL